MPHRHGQLASEVGVLAQGFHEFALADRRARDFTAERHAAARSARCWRAFPVYRTYVDRDGARPEDFRFIDWAIAVAKKRSPAVDTSIFDFIRAILTNELDAHFRRDRREAARLAMRFQQVSGPVIGERAGGYELLRYVRLLALNESARRPASLRRLGRGVPPASTRNARSAGRTPC